MADFENIKALLGKSGITFGGPKQKKPEYPVADAALGAIKKAGKALPLIANILKYSSPAGYVFSEAGNPRPQGDILSQIGPAGISSAMASIPGKIKTQEQLLAHLAEQGFKLEPSVGPASAVTRILEKGSGKTVANIPFTKSGSSLIPEGSYIPPEYQGKGLATGAYAATEKATGMKIAPELAKEQTEAGQALHKTYGGGKFFGESSKLHNTTTPEEFSSAIQEASKTNPKITENVTPYSIEDYSKMQTYLSPDKKSGYALRDGELINVFSAEKGRGDKIVSEAVEQGAEKLDAFEGYLPKLYSKHGFEEVKREPNWTQGQPDVVYMQRKAALEKLKKPK